MNVNDEIALPPKPALSRLLVIGMAAVVFGFGGVLTWSLTTTISGAVIASGFVVVETDPKKVQHPQGGVVGEIHAKNGQRVQAGDLLLVLDPTLARTNLAQIESQLIQLTARASRLEAERVGAKELVVPSALASLGQGGMAVFESEQMLFETLRQTRNAQVSQLRERKVQSIQEIEGLQAQLEAKALESQLIDDEMRGVEQLYSKNLVSLPRYVQLKREVVRLKGESSALAAAIARIRAQITEIEFQILSIDQQARADASKELREVEAQLSQLQERQIAAIDTLQRIEVRSPHSGYVHESIIHTIGGVISSGEVLMQIVPDSDRLIVEVRLSPADIDQARVGQKAMLRFSAFNHRTTPDIVGNVERISADISRDAQTQSLFYVARVGVSEREIEKLGTLRLLPGMPVEVFIESSMRTPFSYLAKPLVDGFHRAYRER